MMLDVEFLAYLSGIETIISGIVANPAELILQFLAYLSGIETNVPGSSSEVFSQLC
jgi:hypothetical protein